MPKEQDILKAYIFGEAGEDERSAIELRLMTDDDFFHELSLVEEIVIQDYADGNLTDSERAGFERCFFVSEKNRQKAKFARALRKYINENEPKEKTADEKNSLFDSLKAFFISPIPATIAVLIVLSLGGFWIWKAFKSNNSEVLIALNKAYKAERPLQSRITDFDYAPPKNTRGANDEDKTDKIKLARAVKIALDAADQNASAENLHDLGRVYLAEKKFDDAIENLEKASKLEPKNAQIHNDLGVALMEKGTSDNDKNYELLSKSLDELSTAISLDKSLATAYFNKALCLELWNFSEDAKTTWQDFLKLDPSSDWADDARQHLNRLEEPQAQSLSAEDLEQAFLDAFRQRDDKTAWSLLSKNKETITEKYLPQKLATSLTSSEGEKRKELLDALIYAGKLEEENAGDHYVTDLANYYVRSADSKNEILKEAHSLTKEGYKESRNTNFHKALENFNKSKSLLNQAGNIWEAKLVDLFISYSLLYEKNEKDKNPDQNQSTENSEDIEKAEDIKTTQNIEKSLDVAKEVIDFSQSKNYKWLQSIALFRAADSQVYLAQYTVAIKNNEKSLEIAKTTQDFNLIQRNTLVLASLHSRLGQKKIALDYMFQVFKLMEDNKTSFRQKWRNYFTSIELFSSVRLNELVKVSAKEAVADAEKISDAFLSLTQTQAAIVYTKNQDYDKAREFLDQSIQTAERLSDEAVKKRLLAYSFLKLANLESQLGNFDRSAQLYEQSLQTNNSPFFKFETQKGKLLANIALKRNDELEKEIPTVINTAEDDRGKILEDQQKNEFFNDEKSVYDIATEWEFDRGRYEQSFDYNELSNARSLFDSIGNKQTILDSFPEQKNPLKLAEIQTSIPRETQILQYTVLDKKVLIWLITREKFVVRKTEIDYSDLQEKVESYLNTVTKNTNDTEQADALSKELYDLLILPVRSELDPQKEIALIPNKILFHLPFQALISPENKYLLRDFTVFYSPSASVFILCSKNAEKKSVSKFESVLSVGNPSFDRRIFSELPDLPTAEKEAREIAVLYDKPKVLSPKEATKKNFLNLMKTPEVIHFAGHYLVKPGAPLSSSLILAKDGGKIEDGILTNEELVKEKLKNIKLVVLAACDTGVESYYNGEGMVGLSRTFLMADAPLVVASQWKADSDATAQLMKRFHYYRRQEHFSTVAALRQAQIEMIDSNENKFKMPHFWATFSVFGGHANF